MNLRSSKMQLITVFTFIYTSQLPAITSNMTHRVMSSSPLIYEMIDYSQQQTCYEVGPIFSTMYNTSHINQNLILDGKRSLIFDQQGHGDLNPVWLNLKSNNAAGNYHSTVTFSPKLRQVGLLLHWYEQFEKTFIEIKTALVQCKSEIEITEVGGNNGLFSGILNAQQAFTQSEWNYGKIGGPLSVTGLDNIELKFGTSLKIPHAPSSYEMSCAIFSLIEAPTGYGTKAKWLFEPQVGTNHWGIGLGVETILTSNNDLKFLIGANARYLTPEWETRSFDLLENGQWSRYLSLQDTYGLASAPSALGLPAINLLTQPAYINGRAQLNFYTRLAKNFNSCWLELSYNFLYMQPETIGSIETLPTGYGIYTLYGPIGGIGGKSTSSSATINQALTTQDAKPVNITNSMLNKNSGQAGSYSTNNLTARIEKINETFIYGCGASIEVAQSASAISTWNIYAKFEFLFDN